MVVAYCGEGRPNCVWRGWGSKLVNTIYREFFGVQVKILESCMLLYSSRRIGRRWWWRRGSSSRAAAGGRRYIPQISYRGAILLYIFRVGIGDVSNINYRVNNTTSWNHGIEIPLAAVPLLEL